MNDEKNFITIQVTINVPANIVWKFWNTPENIVNWNTASSDWHTVNATNDLQVGGKFNYRMEAKNGSEGFDFWGVYDKIIENKLIENTLGDGRKMKVEFIALGNKTEIKETFEAENVNTLDLQRSGWQNILDNFKSYTENMCEV